MPHDIKLPKASLSNCGRWSLEEHTRFLFGMKLFPYGPWNYVAGIVKTRTERQLRTHAQKYRAKWLDKSKGLCGAGSSPHKKSVVPKNRPGNVSKRHKLSRSNLQPQQLKTTIALSFSMRSAMIFLDSSSPQSRIDSQTRVLFSFPSK
ncbi:hypothetical protein AeMF1_008932 [Aphanomyces euteiches]|nr:hypothetical protein AeMF1_008932 [Aphanomyces euteiches]KAH9183178.1 hypothetical protein AeNC1_014845 [Aphanomyces euteiches]